MILQMWGPHLNASTGYGESARALAAAWRSLGGCVTCREEQEGTEPGQPFLNYSWRLHDLPLEHRGGLVARVMAETSRIPSAWVRQLQAVDQVWVPSAFNREGFILSGVDEGRLRVLPDVWEPPGEMPDALPLPPLPSWRFLSVFNHRTLFRKGVDLLLRAYHRGFSRRDDVVLILRTDMDFPAILRKLGMTWGACAPRVHVVSHRLDEARMLGLYRSCNAFVLPSRGEGVGRPYLAALWTGLPVIASGWGGALSFLNGKNARLIPCRPFPARRYWRRLPHPWEWQGDLAEPDCDGLTEAMRDVFCSHPLTKTPGHLPEGCRSAHVAGLMKGYLEELGGGEGTRMALEGEERILSRLYPVPGRSGGTMASAERRFRRISVWGAGEGARKALRILVGRGCPFVLEHLVSPDGQGRVLEGYPVENPGVLTASGSLLVLAVQPDFIQPVLRRLPPGFSGPIHVFAV